MKKIVKVLPVALAMMLFAPAFADPPTPIEDSATFNITVPEFLTIKRTSAESLTAKATINDDYTSITGLTGDALTATFHVVTNASSKDIYLRAKHAGTGANLLYGTNASALKLVFVNDDASPAVTATNITKITGGGTLTPSDNANAIAFSFSQSAEVAADSTGTNPTVNKDANGVQYTLANGKYDFTFSVTGGSEADTFSEADQAGNYKAVLTLTDASA